MLVKCGLTIKMKSAFRSSRKFDCWQEKKSNDIKPATFMKGLFYIAIVGRFSALFN